MSGSHAHSEGISSRTMWLVTAITFTFCLGEALVGYKSNSLALMADAGHNFADSLALALSAFALWISTKPADNKRTFGYHRVGILVALVNAVGLVTMALVIFWEAIQRLQMPESVQSIKSYVSCGMTHVCCIVWSNTADIHAIKALSWQRFLSSRKRVL